MGWNSEKDAELRVLCEAVGALSAAKIAKRLSDLFGEAISRQAVIGRAKRLAIPLPRSERSPAPVVTVDDFPPPSVAAKVRVIYEPPPLPKERVALVFDGDGIGILLVNAGERDCRYPVNDPPRGQMVELRVCGEPATKGRYCEHCYEKMYVEEV